MSVRASVEILKRKTGEVLERKDDVNLKGFMTWFALQCDTKRYTYRVVE